MKEDFYNRNADQFHYKDAARQYGIVKGGMAVRTPSVGPIGNRPHTGPMSPAERRWLTRGNEPSRFNPTSGVPTSPNLGGGRVVGSGGKSPGEKPRFSWQEEKPVEKEKTKPRTGKNAYMQVYSIMGQSVAELEKLDEQVHNAVDSAAASPVNHQNSNSNKRGGKQMKRSASGISSASGASAGTTSGSQGGGYLVSGSGESQIEESGTQSRTEDDFFGEVDDSFDTGDSIHTALQLSPQQLKQRRKFHPYFDPSFDHDAFHPTKNYYGRARVWGAKQQ